MIYTLICQTVCGLSTNININGIRQVPPLQIGWRTRSKFANCKSSFTQDPSTRMENTCSFVRFNWWCPPVLCKQNFFSDSFPSYGFPDRKFHNQSTVNAINFVKCYRCGECGHYIKQCRSEKVE